MGNITRAAQQAHRQDLGIRGVRTAEGKHTFEFHLVAAHEVLDGIIAFENGRRVSQEVDAVVGWLRRCFRTPQGKNALCLTCDYEFGRHKSLPLFYSLVRGENSIGTTGICETCCRGKTLEEILAMSLKAYEGYFGGDLEIRLTCEGHA